MQINIEKRAMMIILGVILLLAGALVYAYGGSQPSVMGHSLGELGIRESGYSIFVENATGTSYHDCKTTCNGEMQILNSTTIPTCFYYTNGEKTSAFQDCPSGKFDCGIDFPDRYCAVRNTLNSIEMGKILVD